MASSGRKGKRPASHSKERPLKGAKYHHKEVDSDADDLFEEYNYGEHGGFGDSSGMSTGLASHGAGDTGMGHQSGQNAPPVEEEMAFGFETKPVTKCFKKSFLVNVNNGKANLALAETVPGVGTQSSVTWNEGWQIIPWGDLRAYMTPTDYYEVSVMARKWRIKKMTVKLEGIVPFQVDLSGATNSSTAMFNNRINLHMYTDDGELLPDRRITATTLDDDAHSHQFTAPWGEGDVGLLKSPSFTFVGARQPSQYRYSADNSFSATQPQRFFSLYNTGRVKSYYPGQKFSKSWINPNKAWVGRSPNQTIEKAILLTGIAAADTDDHVNAFTQQAYSAGPTGTAKGTLSSTPTVVAWNERFKSIYLDTGIPIPYEGMPYILVRVEPYPNLGVGGGLIDVYAQAHLHYEMEVEMVPLEKPMQYVPINVLSGEPQGSYQGLQNQVYKDSSLGITDNKVGRVAGTGTQNVIYT